MHTLLVALVGLVPGFGAGAYLLAGPLRSNRALAVIGTDRLLRRLPFHIYTRLHFAALTTWFARPRVAPSRRRSVAIRDVITGIGVRVRDLAHHYRFLASILAVNAGVLLAGAVAYLASDSPGLSVEPELVSSLGSAELVAAGVLGLLAFAAFWRGAGRRAPASEAAGIFFWGLSGLGLLAFATDGFFAAHERAARWMADNLGMLPLLTDHVDSLIPLAFSSGALAVLFIFRRELLSLRHSSVLLAAGAAAAGLMVATNVYGKGWIRPAEFPVQAAAVGLILLAYAMRYREVRAATGEPLIAEDAGC